MIGTIQVVQNARSGNSLRVQIGGQWYSAKKDSGLTETDVGKNVTFILGDTPFPPGSTNYWINEYTFTDVSTTPAAQAMDHAMAGQQYPAHMAPPSGEGMHPDQRHNVPRGTSNKDSMIGAFALSKCCTPGSPEQVFENFRLLYNKLENWDSQIPF